MKKLLIVSAIFIASALCGCSAAEQATASDTQSYSAVSVQETSETDPTQIIESEFPFYADVKSLAADSVLAVMGQYGAEEPEIVNTAKDAENSLVESKDVYAECRVFIFHVQEVLKGDCSDDEIRVGLSYGIRPAGFSELAVKDTYLEPTTDNYKILFLLYSASDGFYYPTSQPYQLCFSQATDSSAANGSTAFTLDTSIDGLNESFAIEAASIGELRKLIG